MRSQKGFAHLLVILLLIVGLVVGTYVSLNPVSFRSKASTDDMVVTSGVVGAGQVFEPRPGITSCVLGDDNTACMESIPYGYPCQRICCGYVTYNKGASSSCSATQVVSPAPDPSDSLKYKLVGSKISASCMSYSTDGKCMTLRVTWDRMSDFISGEANWFLVRGDETADGWNGPRDVNPIVPRDGRVRAGEKNYDSAAWNQKKNDNFVDLDISGGENYKIEVQGFLTTDPTATYNPALGLNIYYDSYWEDGAQNREKAQKVREIKRIGQITLFSDLKIADIPLDGIRLNGSEIGAVCIRRDSSGKCNRIKVSWDVTGDLFSAKDVAWYLVRADDMKNGWKDVDDSAAWNQRRGQRFVELDVNGDDAYYISIQGFYPTRGDESYSDSLATFTYWDSYFTDGVQRLDRAVERRETKRIGNIRLFNDLKVVDFNRINATQVQNSASDRLENNWVDRFVDWVNPF